MRESTGVEVSWRVVRARGVLTRGSEVRGGEGLPTPEVLRRFHEEAVRRRGRKKIYKPGTARRLLRLLLEQRRARARGGDNGRVRADLAARFDSAA